MLKNFMRFNDFYSDDRATFKLVLVSSLVVASLILVQLLYSLVILENLYVITRAIFVFAIIVYLVCTHQISLRSHRVASWMLIGLYLFVGLSVLLLWGVNAPIGILTLGFVIFLANVILGSKYIFFTVFCVAVGLIAVQVTVATGLYYPDTSNMGHASTFADVISYIIVFGVFGITSWLSGFHQEESLARALRAEQALLREQRLLSRRLSAQARNLRAAQLEEMHQLYKFAELGQLTSSLFHELANHLSVLHLDIQEFSSDAQGTTIQKINESIEKIDEMVKDVRGQITHEHQSQKLNLYDCIEIVIADMKQQLRPRNNFVRIILTDHRPKKFTLIKGDPVRFRQAVAILLKNAVQACSQKNCPPIEIRLEQTAKNAVIKIIDYGSGIPDEQRQRLFTPQTSSKKGGLGIGLYIANQFVATHFGGTIELDPVHQGTCFVITLPFTSIQ